MRKLFNACLAFIVVSTGGVVRAEFTPIAGWDNQLFPSYIIGSATLKGDQTTSDPTEQLGDPNGLLGVEIVAPADNTRVEITVQCDEYLEPSTITETLESEGESYTIFPKVKYRFDRLSQCQQVTPATVTFKVKIEDDEIQEKTTTVTFRPIHDCPIKVEVGEKILDTSVTVATFVNEQHPYVDKLLREALNIGVVDKFIGYQGTDDDVIRQVYSVWDLLVARDVRYSSITTTAADSDEILSQHIRMLEDTINNQQANCVDGSVLMVSMLRKIGIDSFLVLVPGHCYVGFYVDEKRERALGLETTLVGEETELPDDFETDLENAVDESLQGDLSWPSFVQAIIVGTKNLGGNAEKFKSGQEQDYKLIDINRARRMGVLPIPFKSKELFVNIDHSEYVRDNGTEEDLESQAEESDEGWENEQDDESEGDAEEEDEEGEEE